jgi:hypothetical protein
VTDRFQDGRRRHVGNSSECCKMGNYHPISMKIGTQTEKNIVIFKVTKAKVTDRFQDGRSRHVRDSSSCYKMGNYLPILMEIGMQTKTDMLSSKITKWKCAADKQQTLNVKNDIVLKRQRCMSANL